MNDTSRPVVAIRDHVLIFQEGNKKILKNELMTHDYGKLGLLLDRMSNYY